jgi:hypothetical protein
MIENMFLKLDDNKRNIILIGNNIQYQSKLLHKAFRLGGGQCLTAEQSADMFLRDLWIEPFTAGKMEKTVYPAVVL